MNLKKLICILNHIMFVIVFTVVELRVVAI